MRLYKAIKYDGVSEKVLNSDLVGKHKDVHTWKELVEIAFSHISHGDKKKNKDAWISVTYDYEVARSYLENEKYDFNCIAVIDLPNTDCTGYIYDDTLRKFGYIDKDLGYPKKDLYSIGNEDGVIALLDMSSPFTLMYLGTYLWLKGNINPLGNLRANRTAKKYKEVLLLANNVKFQILEEREEIEQNNSEILDNNEILYMDVYTSLVLQNMQSKNALSKEIEQYCLYRGINGEENEQDWYNIILNYFQNARYRYQPKKASTYYYGNNSRGILSFHSLPSEYNHNLDKEEYEIVVKNRDIGFNKIIGAYIYATLYIYLCDDAEKDLGKEWLGRLIESSNYRYLSSRISELPKDDVKKFIKLLDEIKEMSSEEKGSYLMKQAISYGSKWNEFWKKWSFYKEEIFKSEDVYIRDDIYIGVWSDEKI